MRIGTESSEQEDVGACRRHDGMTLVEVLIVVVIIGILAGLVLPHYTDTSRRAKTSTLLTDLQSIRQGLQRYVNDHAGEFPALARMWDPLTERTDFNGTPGAGSFGPYLREPPVNPFTNGTRVAEDASADWEYDETTGLIRGVAPARVIADFALSAFDVVPTEGSPQPVTPDDDQEEEEEEDDLEDGTYADKARKNYDKWQETGDDKFRKKYEKYAEKAKSKHDDG